MPTPSPDFSLYQRTFDRGLKAARAGLPLPFFFDVVHPLAQQLKETLRETLPIEDPLALQEACFLFQHADFVLAHLTGLFAEHEGVAHSADKARTVLRALAQHLVFGTPIDLAATEPPATHHPVRILLQESDVLAVFTALQALYQGRTSAYCALCTRMTQHASQ